MNRRQFTFYESFASALRRIRKKSERCDAYDAIVACALYGQEPDMEALPNNAAIAIELIRPTLEASRRKAIGAARGSSGKEDAKIGAG